MRVKDNFSIPLNGEGSSSNVGQKKRIPITNASTGHTQLRRMQGPSAKLVMTAWQFPWGGGKGKNRMSTERGVSC